MRQQWRLVAIAHGTASVLYRMPLECINWSVLLLPILEQSLLFQHIAVPPLALRAAPDVSPVGSEA